MSMIINEAPVIFDVQKKPAMRKRSFTAPEGRGEDGKPSTRMVARTERRPNGKVMIVLDSDGNDLPLKLSNAMSIMEEDDAYGAVVLRSKSRAIPEWDTEPMLPYTQCPQSDYRGKLPADLRKDFPCTVAEDGKHPIGEDRKTGDIYPCACMAELKRRRQAKAQEREAMRDPKTSANEAMMRGNVEVVAKLTELIANMEKSKEPAAKEPGKK